MFFRALLARMCGGTSLGHEKAVESRQRFAKATHNRYPKLAPLVLQLLRASVQDGSMEPGRSQVEKVQISFPALEIIQRVGVPESHQQDSKALLLKLLGIEDWHFRDKAARAFSLMTDYETVLNELREVTFNPGTSQNKTHGLLLCMKYLAQRDDTEQRGINRISGSQGGRANLRSVSTSPEIIPRCFQFP